MLVIMFNTKKIMGLHDHLFKIAYTVRDDYTENKLMNMQLGNLRSQKNTENIDKKSDERNPINMIDEKISDERNYIYENDEDISTADIKVLKLGALCSKMYLYIRLKNNLMR